MALCLALLVMALGVMSASAATFYVTPGNLQGWGSNSNQGLGSSVITAAEPRSGTGSVELRGNRTRWQRGNILTNYGLLSEVTDFSFDWMVATDSISTLGPNYTPTFRLLIRNGSTNVELSWEGANQGTTVTKGTWVTTDATASNQKFWRYQSGGSAGAPPYKTLSEWQNDTTAFLPTAYVYGFSVGVGGGPGGDYHAFADNITLGFNNAPDTFNFEMTPPAKLTLNAADDLICGAPVEMEIDLSDVANLYGYEFMVNYDDDLVSATGAFDDGWFNTANGLVVPGWDAFCEDGTCRFSASLKNPTAPISTVPAKTIARITFTPLTAGSFSAAASGVLLSDIDGMTIPVDVNDAEFDFDVCGMASVSGKVSLQGRATPMDGGFIKLIDTSNQFTAVDATFDANGNYTVSNIPVMAGGTPYVIQATHYLYLGNQKALTLNPGDALTGHNTRLLGGDADNSGVFDNPTDLIGPNVADGVGIEDIGCIGSDFAGAPKQCGSASGPYYASSSTDINKDGTVNIQDLSIAGGNYDKDPFQNW